MENKRMPWIRSKRFGKIDIVELEEDNVTMSEAWKRPETQGKELTPDQIRVSDKRSTEAYAISKRGGFTAFNDLKDGDFHLLPGESYQPTEDSDPFSIPAAIAMMTNEGK